VVAEGVRGAVLSDRWARIKRVVGTDGGVVRWARVAGVSFLNHARRPPL
jgi:hypothetical protein